MKRSFLLPCAVVLSLCVQGQTVKILFDASQAEMAGNGDWVIDADVYNIGVNSAHLMVTGAGNEANPQRTPSPAQSGITGSTSQSYWKGALSYWAVDLVRQGFMVETLPYNGLITYGVSTNAQDLSNYRAFIVCEPNIRFSTSEKAALRSYVQNGGGLFMIADHTASDRNNDGWDSPAIWNDLMTGNPFGLTFDLQNFSQTSSNVRPGTGDPILNGSMGNVTGLAFHNGTSMTLSTSANSTVKGLVYKTGASNTGTSQAIFAAANYGSGKVCGLGDSSVPDDGSGDTNDALYVGYATDVSGSHRKLLVNATKWLVTPGTAAMALQDTPDSRPSVCTRPSGCTRGTFVHPKPKTSQGASTLGMDLFPNPAKDHLNVRFASDVDGPVTISIIDLTGRLIETHQPVTGVGVTTLQLDLQGIPSGSYVVQVSNGVEHFTERFVRE